MKKNLPISIAAFLALLAMGVFFVIRTNDKSGGAQELLAEEPETLQRILAASEDTNAAALAATQQTVASQFTMANAPGANPRYDHTGSLHWDRVSRPFPVVLERGHFGWTAEDGLTDEVMPQLANNSDMLDRLEEDNANTVRRQLVYTTPEFEDEKREIFAGARSSITLPGLDGEEFIVDITEFETFPIDGANPEDTGGFSGVVRNAPDSLVNVGTHNDSWSVLVVHEGRQFNLETREPGELILSQVADSPPLPDPASTLLTTTDHSVPGHQCSDPSCIESRAHEVGVPISDSL